MSIRSSNYRRIVMNIPSVGAVLPTQNIFPAGQPMIEVVVSAVPAAALGYSGEPTMGYIRLHIGDGADPARINSQGFKWRAELDPATGLPIPEMTGLFLSGDGGFANINNLEILIGLPAGTD